MKGHRSHPKFQEILQFIPRASIHAYENENTAYTCTYMYMNIYMSLHVQVIYNRYIMDIATQ